MKASGDLVIGTSGDRKNRLTAETQRRGEKTSEHLTTKARRHGEEPGDWGIARDPAIGGTADISNDLAIGYATSICRPERVVANATPSRRIPTRIISEHAASGSSHETLNVSASGLYQGTGFSRAAKGKNIWAFAPAVFIRVMQTIHATLREIFDESAYERFLLRTHASRSIASYREFTRERDAAMLKKPRCC
jgi:hypothetical protein